jgi:serine/threonine protein kinase
MVEDQLKAAENECTIHAMMNHENIIKLHSYFETAEEYVLLMEYANKAIYLQELTYDNHTPVEDNQELQIYALDLFEGLNHIHSKGIIHCDIKLDNMLAHIEDDDKTPIMKLCDFGLAHRTDPTLGNKALKKNTIGTWGYIAPEIKTK